MPANEPKRIVTPYQDLTGKRFARLLVIARLPNGNGGSPYWLCQCDCGSIKPVDGHSLRSGGTTTCGCLARTQQGRSGTRCYRVWHNMMRRCHCPEDKSYPYYGQRGIEVCARWHTFSSFFEDMGDPPEGLSIDRINNDMGYSPWNCRWATKKTQMRNTRNSKVIEFNGQSRCLTEWAERTGLSHDCLRGRLRQGWSVERALTEPPSVSRRHPNPSPGYTRAR